MNLIFYFQSQELFRFILSISFLLFKWTSITYDINDNNIIIIFQSSNFSKISKKNFSKNIKFAFMSSSKYESIRFFRRDDRLKSNDRLFLQFVIKILWNMKIHMNFLLETWELFTQYFIITQNIIKTIIILNVKIIFQENGSFKTFVSLCYYTQ